MVLEKKTKKHHEHDFKLPQETREYLQERFKQLQDPVVLEVFTKSGQNDQYNQVAISFLTDFTTLSEKIIVNINTIGDEKSKLYGVTRSPTVLINPDQYHIRYTGAPAGEEGRSFIETILLVSAHQSGLSKTSKDILLNLKERRHVQVFVTLSCPYCPGQVLNAFKAAIEQPTLISSECVESAENTDLADTYGVGAVPHTVINEKTISHGLESEEKFCTELVTLESAKEEMTATSQEESMVVDLIIVGGGPAGLTAGIYAARSGLKTVILEKSTVGGQVLITPVVENWPGFVSVPGKQLMDMISTQVRGYVPVLEGEKVQEIKVGKQIETLTNRGRYLGKALIIATGGSHRKLHVPGEDRFYGHGVSYCATCDGFFFKGKKVMVVGGGNTALTDALYLKSVGAEVTIINRSEDFSAEKPLQESVQRENIAVLWNMVVEEIKGKDKVTKVRVKQTKDGTIRDLQTDGIFVGIGEDPNVDLAKDIGVKLSESGYIEIDRGGRTNIPRIYAAGDVTGGVRQIVTAVGTGAVAAVSAFEDMSHQSLQKK